MTDYLTEKERKYCERSKARRGQSIAKTLQRRVATKKRLAALRAEADRVGGHVYRFRIV